MYRTLHKMMQQTKYKSNMDVLRFCPGVGRRIISFHNRTWNYRKNGREYLTDLWWLVRHKESNGTFGKIGGGMKGIECFINWCTEGKMGTGWCFNPIDCEDLVWSPVNDAYIDKKHADIFLDIPIEVKARYVFVKDDDDVLIKVYKRDTVIWEKPS